MCPFFPFLVEKSSLHDQATKIFVNCLLYIQRTKSLQLPNQPQKKNFQYDVVSI